MTEKPLDPLVAETQAARQDWYERVVALEDPIERALIVTQVMSGWREQERRLKRVRELAVAEMRAAGMSLEDIAQALRVSRSRAQQLADDAARASEEDQS